MTKLSPTSPPVSPGELGVVKKYICPLDTPMPAVTWKLSERQPMAAPLSNSSAPNHEAPVQGGPPLILNRWTGWVVPMPTLPGIIIPFDGAAVAEYVPAEIPPFTLI